MGDQRDGSNGVDSFDKASSMNHYSSKNSSSVSVTNFVARMGSVGDKLQKGIGRVPN